MRLIGLVVILAVGLHLASLAALWGSRLYFEYVVPQEYRAYQQLVQKNLVIKRDLGVGGMRWTRPWCWLA
jgi:hypothetical protein